MTSRFRQLPLSKLKGLSVYCQDDLHDLASFMLKLNDARAAYEGSTAITRPTVHGLAETFAELINPCSPDYGPVFAVVEERKLPLRASIEFDDRIRRKQCR